MKDIHELTKKDGQNIVDLFYPDDGAFDKFSFEPIVTEDGHQQVTFSGSSIIGICCRYGINGDGVLIDFDNPKVMKYLYENDYDIGPLFPDLIDYYESLEKECWAKAHVEYVNEDYKDLKKQVCFFKQSVFYKLYKFFNKKEFQQ